MSFMRQLEEYREFSDRRSSSNYDRSSDRNTSPGHARSHGDGRADGKGQGKSHRERDRHRRSRSRSRSRSDRSRSSESSRHRSPRWRRSSSPEDNSDNEAMMERCISDKPTSVIFARGITEFMTETILRDAIISSGYYPRDIIVARKRRSGHVRGWGFVEFYNEEDARKWLESHQGTFYMGEERLSLFYCIPSASPFSDPRSSGDWNCSRCGSSNSRRDVCYKCGTRQEDSSYSDRRSRTVVEKPSFDRVGRSPCNTLLIRELDNATVSERSIKTALYEQQRISSSSIRSCFIMRNPPITETTLSSSACYAFIELSSTHEATQLVDRIKSSKPLVVDGKEAVVTFARYPFTTVMANIHQWLASASQSHAGSSQQEAETSSYAPTQTDVTNAAAAVAQAAMMARQQVETERYKRRVKRRERAERKRAERGERQHRHRSSSASSASSYSGSSGEGESSSSESPHSAESSMAAAAAAACSSVNQQYGLSALPNVGSGGSFQFDTATGYYYDMSSGSYYDPKTRYFYSPKLGQWLTWDPVNGQYAPVPSQSTSGDYNNYDSNVPAADSEEAQREKDKREKAKEARRVQKEMEKWAANQNDQGVNSNASTAKRPPPSTSSIVSSTSANAGSSQAQSTADAAFAFMQTSSSSSADQQSLIDTSLTHLMSLLDWQTFICKLCSRKLSTEEQLRKHCAQSDLHRTNTERWCKEQGLVGNTPALVSTALARALGGTSESTAPAPVHQPGEQQQQQQQADYVYRDRAKERRQKTHGHGSKAHVASTSSSSSAAHHASSSHRDTRVPGGTSLEQPVGGVGQKLIEKMGWEMGKGLGRNSQGRVDPIEAERRQGRVGLGSSGSLSSARPGEGLDYREAAKRTLFQRFHELR